MVESRKERRGSYAKGVAKREEILERALDVIAREGYRGASVKELADAVGLSQAGLLHYFDSKEELFTAILRKRDEVDSAGFGLADAEEDRTISGEELRGGYVGLVRHNADVPGLVQLFARLSVDAADPDHAAHEYFVSRGQSLREVFSSAIASQQAAGRITDAIDPTTLARIFQAVTDGLQVQWMLEPDVDMAGTVDALFDALDPARHSAESNGATPQTPGLLTRAPDGAPPQTPGLLTRATERKAAPRGAAS